MRIEAECDGAYERQRMDVMVYRKGDSWMCCGMGTDDSGVSGGRAVFATLQKEDSGPF